MRYLVLRALQIWTQKNDWLILPEVCHPLYGTQHRGTSLHFLHLEFQRYLLKLLALGLRGKGPTSKIKLLGK